MLLADKIGQRVSTYRNSLEHKMGPCVRREKKTEKAANFTDREPTTSKSVENGSTLSLHFPVPRKNIEQEKENRLDIFEANQTCSPPLPSAREAARTETEETIETL